jgi:hypothetical protein
LRPKTVADFVQLHRARYGNTTYACCLLVFHHPIHNKSNETASDFFMKTLVLLSLFATNGISFDFPSFTYSDQMFQFAMFEKSKERRLAIELGYGFPIGNQWITDALSPHGLSPLKASFLLNARASIQCMIFDSVKHER